jgi:hypothetical protein
MPTNRDEIEAKLHMSDEERAVYWLRRAVRQIDLLEEVTGRAPLNPDMPFADRLARLAAGKPRVMNWKRCSMRLTILSREVR